MSTFDNIRKQIENELVENKSQDPVAVAGRVTKPLTPSGMPDLAAAPVTLGVCISKVGTEKVNLDASTFQLMECESSAPGGKRRYCIVEKGAKAQYANHYINSNGDRVHIVTRDLFLLLYSIINNASKQISKLTNQYEQTLAVKEAYELTIKTLKKNGVID